MAFACHTVCDLAVPLWRAAADKIGTRKRFFEHQRSITVFLVFPSWRDILETLAFVKALPRPCQGHPDGQIRRMRSLFPHP